jgi:hypothetical protein
VSWPQPSRETRDRVAIGRKRNLLGLGPSLFRASIDQWPAGLTHCIIASVFRIRTRSVCSRLNLAYVGSGICCANNQIVEVESHRGERGGRPLE